LVFGDTIRLIRVIHSTDNSKMYGQHRGCSDCRSPCPSNI